MRLFTKIFVSVIVVFSAAFLISGYFILSYSMETCIERELDFALRQYKYDKFTVQAGIIANEGKFPYGLSDDPDRENFFEQISQEVSAPSVFLSEDGTVIYSNDMETDLINRTDLEEKSYQYQVVHSGNEAFIIIGSIVVQDDFRFGFFTKTDIMEAVSQQKILQTYFKRCFLIALVAGVLMISVLSCFLTKPIKKLTKAADRIAGGSYHERLQSKSRDEIGELADSFNRMAAAVEETISSLEDEAQRKEDFVANFAHELKTPLTSIIGYADMIYQKEMTREEEKKAAWYIWNEGMRLESLALKLMDLTVLNRQEFSLIFMQVNDVLTDAVEGILGILEEKGIQIQCDTEEAYIKVDYDLIKTLILNIIDNSVKADCTMIRIKGKKTQQLYEIEITDDGRGIPQQELSRITEAFYMVDKSRSRKQHSAGIGLALVKRIVEIHGGTLSIQSKEGVGTTVVVGLIFEEGGDSDE